MKIYLAADKNFLVYEWGTAIIRYLSQYVKKYNTRIYEFNPDSPPDCGVLFVVGVDTLWLESVAEKIKNTDIVVVMVCGETDIFSNSVFCTGCDMKSVIENSISLFKENRRTKMALFGIQKNDTSDLYKAEIFKRYYNDEDVYMKDERISDTFNVFSKQLHRYDSVICANDLVAVYLLKRLKKMNIDVPGEMQVAGIGNLWIGSHISPTLTTSSDDISMSMDIIFRLIHTKNLCNTVSSLSLIFKSNITARESTGCYTGKTKDTDLYIPYRERKTGNVADEEINMIRKIDSVLLSLSKTDRAVLKELCNGATYSKIAEKVYLTTDSVKYHLKKIYSVMEVRSSKELQMLFDENLINPSLF